MKKIIKYNVTFNGNSEMSWTISLNVYKKLIAIYNSLQNILPINNGIFKSDHINVNEPEICVSDSTGDSIICFDTTIIKKNGNIYESRFDPENVLKNELLKTIPKK